MTKSETMTTEEVLDFSKEIRSRLNNLENVHGEYADRLRWLEKQINNLEQDEGSLEWKIKNAKNARQ